MSLSLEHPAQLRKPAVALRVVALTSVLLWQRSANSRLLAYLTFLGIYTLPPLYIARTKSLWDDEFFTLYLSTTKNWADLIAALSTGADQHPPSYYYLTHLILGA